MSASLERKFSIVLFFWYTVATVASAQTFDTLVNFTSADGNPLGSLVQGIDGNLYVGTNTIYRMTPEGSLSPVNRGPDPSGMVVELNGNLYGASLSGGSQGCGTVFGLTSAGTRFDLPPSTALTAAVPTEE